MIRTPDILPNNLKTIRETRGKGTDETAEAIGMNRSYVSVLENGKANMSGEVALKIMEYFNASFAQLFHFADPVTLEYTTDTISTQLTKIILTQKEYDQFKQGDIIKAVKIIENEYKENDVPGSVHDIIEVSSEEISKKKVVVQLKVLMKEPKVEKLEFDLNIVDTIDKDTYMALKQRGFGKNELFSIDFLKSLLNVTDKDISEALGVTLDGYYDLISAKKKMSVKVMWRMVKFFKVPLEVIMNIPLYREKTL